MKTLIKRRTYRKYKTNKKKNGGIKNGGIKNGGKWSQKYKKSINCNNPKGFSQKQYCKYSRNKK